MGGAGGQPVWRVLVVDDEENLNWSLVTSLRRDNYAADGALTGEDALRRLAAQSYDIVISDVKMPGMDGFELLQWLRAHRPQTRVVMMTAFGSPTDRAEALRGGVIAYLEKPFDLRALKDELRRLTVGAPPEAPAGEAQGYDLLEVARVISLARRDLALVVDSGGRSGRLRFLRGDLIYAESGELRGDDAFVALTLPRNGRAQPEPWDGRSARNVTQPLSALISRALTERERGPAAPAPAGDTRAGPDPVSSTMTPTAPAAEPPAPAMPAASPASTAGAPPAAALDASPPAAPSPSTVPFSPLSPAQVGGAQTALAALVAALPARGGAALLRPDGVVVAQRWVDAPDAPAGALAHLAACAQAALRALLLADWGELEEVEIASAGRHLLLRRLGRTERAVVLVVVAPRDADPDALRAGLRQHEAALLEALH